MKRKCQRRTKDYRAVPWMPDIIIPLDLHDPRNADRHHRQGERIRLRFNKVGAEIVDFVVQYETPVRGYGHSHAVVLRSDGTHAPHYDLYDALGKSLTVTLPVDFSPEETINRAIEDIKQDWPAMRQRYFEGLHVP